MPAHMPPRQSAGTQGTGIQVREQMFEKKPPSRAVLQANKAFKPAQSEPTEYEKTQKAAADNRERLKAERLAREAAGGDGPPQTKTSP
jgi:hypothetical protein